MQSQHTCGGEEPPPQLWSAGVDYVRLTYKAQGEELERVLGRYRTAASEAGRVADSEAPVSAWAWCGYTGSSISTAAFGAGLQGAILQVSGAAADTRSLLELPFSGVPRLDVQVTTWNEPSPSDVPRRVSRETVAARAGARGRPWKVAYIDGFGAGDTTYIGSRDSETFVRVYDKAAETGTEEYRGAVRYEVEFKNGAAAAAYARLVADVDKACDTAAGIVRAVLLARGVALPNWVQAPHMLRPKGEVGPSSTDGTLTWLASGVRPSIARLLEKGVPYEVLHRVLFGRPHSHDIEYLGDYGIL